MTMLCTSKLFSTAESLRGNPVGNQIWSDENQQKLLENLQHGLLSTVQKFWGQCGGKTYSGPTQCEAGSECIATSEWYSQCEWLIFAMKVSLWGQCDGKDWTGDTQCVENTKCTGDEYYRQCRPCENDDPCLSDCDLLNFEVWRRETGYWIGDFILLDANGDINESANWNYPYGDYKGLIKIDIQGTSLMQRNVFLYPPQDNPQKCGLENDVKGEGICGQNGNEKIFSAKQDASDCSGNLAGPYETFGITLDTTTTIIGTDTVIYRVAFSEHPIFGSAIIQNQLTTLPNDSRRVRTAQGYDIVGNPSYGSYYRERKVTKEEWMAELSDMRSVYKILESDHCGWKQDNDASGLTCCEHFEMDFPGSCTYSP